MKTLAKKLAIFLFTIGLVFGFSFFDEKPKNNNPDNNKNQNQILQGGEILTDSVTSSWTTLETSPNAFSRSCCAYIQTGDTEYVYQFGGGSGTQLKSIARYNIAFNTWTVLSATLNLDVSAGTAILHNGFIYIFGGNSASGTLGSAQRFNVNSNTTTTLASMPVSVTDAAVVKYHDSLVYIIGGGTGIFGPGYVNNVQVYNINTNSYSMATSYPISAGMMGFGIDGNKIICAAGWTGNTGTSNAYKGVIDSSNHLNITWSALSNHPGGGLTRSASYFIQKGTQKGIMMTGGALNGATPTNRTYFFNTVCEQWDSAAPNSLARSNFKATGRGDSIAWVVAGFTTVGVGTTERIMMTNISCQAEKKYCYYITASCEGRDCPRRRLNNFHFCILCDENQVNCDAYIGTFKVKNKDCIYNFNYYTDGCSTCKGHPKYKKDGTPRAESDTVFIIYLNNGSVINLNLLPEGLYEPSTNKVNQDTVSVFLRSTISPYSIIDSTDDVLDSTGIGDFYFFDFSNETPFYIVVKHRNSIETWSNLTLSFDTSYASYNFTTSQSQAYGNNQVLKGTKWCIYSGDINQDGVIDGSDLSLVDNAAFNYTTGYNQEDVTGDNYVDASDISIVDNNAFNGVGKITPLGSLFRAQNQINKKMKDIEKAGRKSNKGSDLKILRWE